MKRNVDLTGKTAELLNPGYVEAVKKFAVEGIVTNEDQLYLGEVWLEGSGSKVFAGLFYCHDFVESSVSENPDSKSCHKKIACVPFFQEGKTVYDGTSVQIRVLEPGSVFEYDGAVYQVPVRPRSQNPYVLSLADALGLFHAYGFVDAREEDVFIGTFSFYNRTADELSAPEARRHFGIGVSYMIRVEVDSVPHVAVVRAFNEMLPKSVICCPEAVAVIRRYLPHDSFRTVCGEMALINGIMVNYGHWLKNKLNQIHDTCSAAAKLQLC